ncbi:MAG TPA: aspartate aminotransferase family protein [Thermoanaerobaculia bacterium]|nr:aspartate aminotransferase family protein [Thermoanaerobaculia bacterium]
MSSDAPPPSPRLGRGDLPPAMRCRPPGPRTRELATEISRYEAPGINTLVAGDTRLMLAEALGANLLDVDGNRYVDLTAGFGVAAVGHRHPRVLAAIADQASRLLHGLGDVYAHPERVRAARALCARAPSEDARVYWAVSGSDAVEVALKTARLVTGADHLLAFVPGYHGLTLGALRGTSRAAFREPFAGPLEALTDRLPFGGSLAPVSRRLARSPRVGACLVEPVIGREGILLPPAGWLAELADLCRRHGALLIADEVFTGIGRTGRFWACEEEGVTPDLLCCGKALGGGLPLAAVLASSELLAVWEGPGEARHTATFVAHPVACAAASAVLEVVDDERLVERARRLGGWLGERLRAAAKDQLVRGRGLAWAVEAPDAARAHRWVDGLLDRGVVALAGGPEGRVLQVTPPLVVTEGQLEHALAALAEVVAAG